jgi:tripartite-type tricarboxylate transporter receptor subunit TctC
LPNVPTFEELGIKDFDMVTYTGIFGPAGMPAAVVEKLSAALQKTLAQQSVKERFNSLGVDIITLDRNAFAAYVKKDFEDNQAIAKAAKIVMQ